MQMQTITNSVERDIQEKQEMTPHNSEIETASGQKTIAQDGATKDVILGLNVTPTFKREFKSEAAKRDLPMNRLLELAFESY
jgi:hypothetical protein